MSKSLPESAANIQSVSKYTVAHKRTSADRKVLKRHIYELLWLERLLRKYDSEIDARVEHTIRWDNQTLPVYSLTLGNTCDRSVPTLLLTGAVHGVERIGTQVILSWLTSLLERMSWDDDLRMTLEKIQLVIVPMVNPVGVYRNSRCNGNGVDLNRNSPINASDNVPFLCGGQRISHLLPWYRGRAGDDMEDENKALERVVTRQLYTRPFSLILDVHSGFGMKDRLWFPYAFRKKAIGNIDQFLALKLLWERSFPNHNYVVEPQSLHYLTHGDIWDYFYLKSLECSCDSFMPLTLELGSWAWIKKRPQQLLNFAGLFNPQKRHRHSRVLRTHIVLFDFLLAASLNHSRWLPGEEQSIMLKQAAKSLWFDGSS